MPGAHAPLPTMGGEDMAKHMRDRRSDTGFSVGFPVGIIAISMIGIATYLVALGVEVPPPATNVYLASEGSQ